MGLWDLYFIAKLFFYFTHRMGFHPWLNLVFAAFLWIPIGPGIPHVKRLKLGRQLLALPIGAVLFYYDTWLPPITRVAAQVSQLEQFTPAYLAELAGRFVNPWLLTALVALVLIYFVARKRLRMSSIVVVGILATFLPVGQEHALSAPGTGGGNTPTAELANGPPNDAQLAQRLDAFYQNEATRAVHYPTPAPDDPPFDILLLQVCSLSWDDVDHTQRRNHSLFHHFDIEFDNFSSAASYSGPAAIRLLRGSCGQGPHQALYDAPGAGCTTMADLQAIGYEPQLALNHDGRYGGFLDEVRKHGGLSVAAFEAASLPSYLLAFDGSPVHDDYDELSAWWHKRLANPAPRVALFYNTVSLHDGNQRPGEHVNSLSTYPARLTRLLDDVDKFLVDLRASGRRAVVVFIPEHGAAVRGDRMQVAGLREIPTPRISLVPVGIKLVGLTSPPRDAPVIILGPSSYFAVAQLLANFVASPPFAESSPPLASYLRDLPATDFVAENDGLVVMRQGASYYVRTRDGNWLPYATQ